MQRIKTCKFLLHGYVEQKLIFLSTAQQPLVGQEFIIIEASRSHYLRNTTIGRTSLREWSARPKDLKTENNRKRQTSIPPAGFVPSVPSSERPQTHVLDRLASVTSSRALEVVWQLMNWEYDHFLRTKRKNGKKLSWRLSQYYPGFHVEGMSGNTVNFSEGFEVCHPHCVYKD